MPTIKEVLNLGTEFLRKSGIDSNRLDSRVLIAEVLSLSMEEVLAKGDHVVSTADFTKFMLFLGRRSKHEPIAYIIGKKEFYSTEFIVDENVLIPRPDSETLVDEVLRCYDKSKEIKILELGVGSGCLLLTILKNMPNASGVAIDIKAGAISVAKANYKNLALHNKVKFIISSWNDFECQERFDLIISNPPYIRCDDIEILGPNVKNYEPLTALDGGADGLMAYKELAPIIQNFLKADGMAILECGEHQHLEIAKIMQESNLHTKKYSSDLANKIRCVILKKI